MPDIKAVIFDLDGCLVDSEPYSLEALAAEMREMGVKDAHWRDLRDAFLGVSLHVVMDHIAKRAGKPCPEDFPDRFEARLFDLFRKHLQVVEDAPAMLGQLRDAGAQLAIGTGGSIRRMNETLRITGLASYFQGTAFSADQVTHGKPAPDLFLFAAEQIGVMPGDCVVLEDSPHGVAGAVAAGMTPIGFVGGSHLEGIAEAHAARLRDAGAGTVLTSLDQFAPLLQVAA